MPKATLSFKLPEEREEFETACKAGHYQLVIAELDNYLRNKIKYETLSEVEVAIYQAVRDKLWEFKSEE